MPENGWAFSGLSVYPESPQKPVENLGTPVDYFGHGPLRGVEKFTCPVWMS
jgi:hypothetical protein